MANGGGERKRASSDPMNESGDITSAVPQAIAHGSTFPDSADGPSNLVAALQQAAKTSAGLRYVLADGTEIVQSYRELWDDAVQLAQGLASNGIAPNECVILQVAECANFPSAFWGCVLRGCIPVPITVSPLHTQQSSPLLAALKLLNRAAVLTDAVGQSVVSQTLSQFSSRSSSKPSVDMSDGDSTDAERATSRFLPTVLQLDEVRQAGETVSDTEIIDTSTIQPNDLALLLLTSGSTGTPKGVRLTQQNLRVSAYGMATANRLSSSDLTLNWMPLEHVASLVMFHITEVYLGCSQIHVANERVLKRPLTWLDLMSQYRVTATWAPNFAYGLVNDQLNVDAIEPSTDAWDLSSVRWMGNGAEAVVGKTTRRFLQYLIPYGLSPHAVSPGYGMSETASGIVHSHEFSLDTTSEDVPFVTVGRPIPGVSIRIVNEDDQVVLEGTMGQLQVSGLTVMAGYYQAPDFLNGSDSSSNGSADSSSAPSLDPNAQAFTADGWFRTGDLGVLQNGKLTITGRQKDVIILNGVNYFSHDIEAAVEELEWVEVSFTAACGVSRPGDSTEQLAIFFHPIASVQTTDRAIDDGQPVMDDQTDVHSDEAIAFSTGIDGSWSPDMLMAWVRQIRAQVMNRISVVPTYVIPVETAEIPKTAIGKIQRRQLSQRFSDGVFDTRIQQVAQALETIRGDRPT
ncbi:MAG: AMP-binding protein, partial [Cyanobacteria bacterium J06627_8]